MERAPPKFRHIGNFATATRQRSVIQFLLKRFEQPGEFFVLMFFAAVGFVAVGDEQRMALITERIFDQRVRFDGEQLAFGTQPCEVLK